MTTSMRTFLLLFLFLTLTFGCRSSFDQSTLKPDAKGFIPWNDAKRAILSGDVVAVAQNHAGVVWITFNDGTTFKAQENRIDEVLEFIRDNNLQDKITFATE